MHCEVNENEKDNEGEKTLLWLVMARFMWMEASVASRWEGAHVYVGAGNQHAKRR